MTTGRQWQCECGVWIDDGWSMHIHDNVQEPTLGQMIAGRRASEFDMYTDPLAVTVIERTVYWRNHKEPTRDKPL